MFKREEAETMEQGRPEQAPVPQPGQEAGPMPESNEVTIVGAGARLEGTVVSAGNLRIDGQVKGEINAEGDVALSPQSKVEADIKAQNVSIAGSFKGTIVVSGRAHLANGGRLQGDVTSKALVIEEGGIFHGQSIMDGGAGGAASGQGKGASAGSSGAVARAERPRAAEGGSPGAPTPDASAPPQAARTT